MFENGDLRFEFFSTSVRSIYEFVTVSEDGSVVIFTFWGKQVTVFPMRYVAFFVTYTVHNM